MDLRESNYQFWELYLQHPGLIQMQYTLGGRHASLDYRNAQWALEQLGISEVKEALAKLEAIAQGINK